MKIKLYAFGRKLSGMMEVPENTSPRFDLILDQPISVFNYGFGEKAIAMNKPFHTLCTFEWTGKYIGFGEKKVREYQLINIEKR